MLQNVLLATGVVLVVNGWSLLSGVQVRGTIALNLLLRVTSHRILGWYCSGVAVVAVPIAFGAFHAGDPWFGLFWLLWSGLWLLFFLIMGLDVQRVSRLTGSYALAISLVTCLGPGSLIATGAWQPQ